MLAHQRNAAAIVVPQIGRAIKSDARLPLRLRWRRLRVLLKLRYQGVVADALAHIVNVLRRFRRIA